MQAFIEAMKGLKTAGPPTFLTGAVKIHLLVIASGSEAISWDCRVASLFAKKKNLLRATGGSAAIFHGFRNV